MGLINKLHFAPKKSNCQFVAFCCGFLITYANSSYFIQLEFVIKFKSFFGHVSRAMQGEHTQFEKRKQDHIELALLSENQAHELNPFDGISLMHDALPDLDFDTISIQSRRFEQNIPTPFLVSSMTAGHQQSVNINRNLVTACAEKQWAMGVGSQRRELSDPHAGYEWQELRRDFPNVDLMSNIGIAQLITSSVAYF